MENNSRFNIPEAMARLMNNKNLYQKILSRFEKDYEAFDAKVIQFAKSGDYENAVFQMHTIKGVAGNIGATELARLSKELELLCKNSEPFEKMQPLFEQFSKELQLVIQEIRSGVNLG